MFDTYVEGSIKDSERNRRQDKAPIEMNIHDDTPLPVEMDRIWSCSNNKLKLLHTQAIERGIKTSSTMHVVASFFLSCGSDGSTCKGVMDGNSAEIPDLCPEVEEADTRIMPSVRSGIQRSVDLSGDTDVFVLLIHYCDVLHSEGIEELWIGAGVVCCVFNNIHSSSSTFILEDRSNLLTCGNLIDILICRMIILMNIIQKYIHLKGDVVVVIYTSKDTVIYVSPFSTFLFK